jgi:hypothetical protein
MKDAPWTLKHGADFPFDAPDNIIGGIAALRRSLRPIGLTPLRGGYCQLKGLRASFAARSGRAGQHNRRAGDFPTRAAAPPTQRAYHGRLS